MQRNRDTMARETTTIKRVPGNAEGAGRGNRAVTPNKKASAYPDDCIEGHHHVEVTDLDLDRVLERTRESTLEEAEADFSVLQRWTLSGKLVQIIGLRANGDGIKVVKEAHARTRLPAHKYEVLAPRIGGLTQNDGYRYAPDGRVILSQHMTLGAAERMVKRVHAVRHMGPFEIRGVEPKSRRTR